MISLTLICSTQDFALGQGLAFLLYIISFPSALAPKSGACCDSYKQDRAHWEQDREAPCCKLHQKYAVGKQCVTCSIRSWKKCFLTCRSRWAWEIEAAGILECFEEQSFGRGSAKRWCRSPGSCLLMGTGETTKMSHGLATSSQNASFFIEILSFNSEDIVLYLCLIAVMQRWNWSLSSTVLKSTGAAKKEEKLERNGLGCWLLPVLLQWVPC